MVNWRNEMPLALGYMMLSRPEGFQDLYIAGALDAKKIRCDPKALKEAQRLEEISLTNLLQNLLPSNLVLHKLQ